MLMDDLKMARLNKMDSANSYELLRSADTLGKVAAELKSKLEQSFLREQIVEVVEGYYDLGKVLDVDEIFGGYINRSFKFTVLKDGAVNEYFLRKYKRSVTENEILFEHDMISHSIANGLDICASVIPTLDGPTFVKPQISRSKFAVYTFLQGEDKYTWDNPIMEDPEYESAARVLATFHNATRDFDPKGRSRVEPPIVDMVTQLPAIFKDCAKQNRNTKFHLYYTHKLDTILNAINSNTIPERDLKKMPVNAIHCDFHPGNLKFTDHQVVGIFDFDWSKIDLRLFDVCLALAYCTASWDEHTDGTLLLDKCRIFLAAYQEQLCELNGLSPLNQTELKHLPTMMAMANFFLLNWDIVAYYDEEGLNDYEYLAYLKHNVRLLEWIEQNKEEFAAIAASIEPLAA